MTLWSGGRSSSLGSVAAALSSTILRIPPEGLISLSLAPRGVSATCSMRSRRSFVMSMVPTLVLGGDPRGRSLIGFPRSSLLAKVTPCYSLLNLYLALVFSLLYILNLSDGFLYCLFGLVTCLFVSLPFDIHSHYGCNSWKQQHASVLLHKDKKLDLVMLVNLMYGIINSSLRLHCNCSTQMK